ncbi:MAG: hypothetical protein PsegKO_33000 [Pseudohongiellaceae bacterium]
MGGSEGFFCGARGRPQQAEQGFGRLIATLIRHGHDRRELLEVYTLPQLRLFYREALAQEAEAARAQAILMRSAQHANKDGFAKLLKSLATGKLKPRRKPDGRNQADSLLGQLQASGIPIHKKIKE